VLRRPAVLGLRRRRSAGRRQTGGEAPDALRSFSAPQALASRRCRCDLPRRLGVRVIEIKRPARSGAEWIVPGATTVLVPGDLLVVIGPTGAVESLAAGRLAAKGAVPAVPVS
jgi:uncharacterized protein with PhoU and TrkA domain